VLLVGGGLCAVLFFLIGRRLQSVAPAIPANDRTTALQTDIQRLQQEVEELKKTSEGKTVFLASISHELRTPLTSIIGFADLLEDGSYGALPAPASPVVHKIKQHAEVQVRLVNELLDMARIDAGRLDLTVSPFQLGDCLESAYNTVHTQMLAKGLSFVADVPERPITLRASYHRLHQVFVNLFSNAVKFTAQGQVGVRVRLGPTAVEVDVWDTGIGMTPVQAAVIFDEFRQGDASIRKQYGGTGLGLAICRKIVALHDGRISVQSRPGQGSTFTVWLPLRDSVVQTAT
jgi:signal transduction histidine kinase